MQKITVLITGVTGLVGDGLARFFLNRGYSVIGTSRKNVSSWHPNLKIVNINFSKFNLTNQLEEIINQADWIIHNAAKIKRGEMSIEEGLRLFRSNTTIIYDFLRILAGYPKKKFIFISSARPFRALNSFPNKLIGYNNFDEYSTSKVMAEIICNQFVLANKVKSLVMRISAPYGYVLNNAVLSKFIKKVRLGEDITIWGNGTREQIFTFVEDIGLACELACQNDAVGVFHISGGKPITMKQLAKEIIHVFPESDSKVVFEDRIDPEEGEHIHYSTEKARKVFDYSPQHTIHQGLEKIADFMIKNDL